MKIISLLLFPALLIPSCLPQDVRLPQSPLLSTLERKSGLIAYVGIDGNVYVSDQGGGNRLQLTDDAVIPQQQGQPVRIYQNPTWTKDGSRVAFSGISSDGKMFESKIMVGNVNEETTQEVYSSDTEYPIYLYWSPDNENLSFISSPVTGQYIVMQSVPAAGGERTLLDSGSPYYWSWAPDGRVMIVHAGGAETASSPQHLAFLRVDPQPLEMGLDTTPASFQAPAWSPDGNRIALARVTDNENQIVVTDAAGENPKPVGTFTRRTAFAWSSDGSKLAYLDGVQASGAGTIGKLHIVDLETSEEIVENQNVAAFFWSPNGKKIAYFLLSPLDTGGSSADSSSPQYAVHLHILDVMSGESRELLPPYLATAQFMNILPYFDQYHQSITIWSPDSLNLVLSFLDGEGNPGIAIVAASGQLEPRLLTDGFIAFWSWK
jgi:TolB protein